MTAEFLTIMLHFQNLIAMAFRIKLQRFWTSSATSSQNNFAAQFQKLPASVVVPFVALHLSEFKCQFIVVVPGSDSLHALQKLISDFKTIGREI